MHYGLSSEQLQLQKLAAQVVADLGARRERYDNVVPLGRSTPGESALWSALVDAGVAALGVTEEFEGPGGDCIDQVVVAEELGAGLARVPFVSACLGAAVLKSAPDPALAERVLAGRPPAVVLPGDKLVIDGDLTDAVLVIRDGALVAIESWSPRPQPCIDRTRSIAAVPAEVPGRVLVDDPAVVAELEADLKRRRAVLFAAESTGVARWCLETAAEYARIRRQFGVPIGTFQAVKHRLADILISVENARAATWGGAWSIASGWRDAPISAAMAKAVATENARAVANATLQIHGGIGVTWEHDVHLYLRRAKVNEQLCGTPAEHFATVAALLLEIA